MGSAAPSLAGQLQVSVGQHSDKGRGEINQDFHGIFIPRQPQLNSKGIAVALADGISSSAVSQVASEAAVSGFLADYFCTSEAWSVKKSAQCVLAATNSWLYSQTRQSQHRYDMDRGYVCTFSAMVIKSRAAHIFHVGDTRIYRLRDHNLEQLTRDHRIWVSREKSYLGRALGINPQLEIDYQELPLEKGDIFIFATDGVHEHIDAQFINDAIDENRTDLDHAARVIVRESFRRGSDDNLTVQIVNIDDLPDHGNPYQINELPLPPMLQARMEFDGFNIIRQLHASSRSHVFLAVDLESNTRVVIKTPSIDLRGDPAYLERFMMEEWIARRINSPYVLKSSLPDRRRNYLYTVSEFVEGTTLTQWMIDNPTPDIETVRGIIEQIAKGLRAFHRLEMLHQDLRPDNIMIDNTGTVRIIDFGSTRVAGISETDTPFTQPNILGTAQYTAPEYFLGEAGTPLSDMFSLGVIAYQMLSGRLPYGTQVAKCRTRAAQNKLVYCSLLNDKRDIPFWLDGVIRKAVHPNPFKRYEALSEFVFNLRQPGREFLDRTYSPLIQRNPVLFWQGLSFILALMVLILLAR